MDRRPDAWITRRTLYEGALFGIGHIVCRPTADLRHEVEYAALNVLALPTSGVFALHDGPRRHVIATPNHAVFISSGSPYRVTFPGCVGDECLTLRLTPVGLLKSSLGEMRGSRMTARKLGHVERVKEAISTSPERKWTLAELAGIAGISPFHLAHLFNEAVGTSVYRYAVRLRLAQALDAVLDSNLDLTSIAIDAGFTSHSHFTARFRAFFGLTPGALRRSAAPRRAAELRKFVTAHPAATA